MEIEFIKIKRKFTIVKLKYKQCCCGVQLSCASRPVITLLVFGVLELLNTRPFIDLFLPLAIGPTLGVVLQHQNLVNERSSIL